MKTIADIRENVETLHQVYQMTIEERAKEARAKIFAYYDQTPEIEKIKKDMDNMENGEYDIDANGDLIYKVEIPKEIGALPFIEEYLTNWHGFIQGGARTPEHYLCQWCGEFISVSWEHDRGSYFVFDHDSLKPIIPKNERITEDGDREGLPAEYVALKIELHMQRKGVFCDVVNVRENGSYSMHWPHRNFIPEHIENMLREGAPDADVIKALETEIEAYEAEF